MQHFALPRDMRDLCILDARFTLAFDYDHTPVVIENVEIGGGFGYIRHAAGTMWTQMGVVFPVPPRVDFGRPWPSKF